MYEYVIDDLESEEDMNQQPSVKELPPCIRQILDQEIKTIIQIASQSPRQHIKLYAQKVWDILLQAKTQNVQTQLDLDIPNPTPSPICSATVGYDHNSSKIFKCFDCIQADNAIQCIACFSAADHKGHNFIETLTGQGCCDCGNDQMLNPKGFCPAHSKKIEKVLIPPTTRQNFLKEGAFYFYMMFWLLERAQKFYFNINFVKEQADILLQQLLKMSRKNYDQKLLITELLRQKLGQIYPNFPKVKHHQLSILEIIFRWQKSSFMEYFCRLAYQIFPVEESRIFFIKQYFLKTSLDPDFNFHHPLRLLNFQFMTCIKLINKLIKAKELQPLRLPSLEAIKTCSHKNHLFLKWIDDMQYPSQMKGTLEYHCTLIEQYNIAQDLFSYRQLPDNQVNKKALDQYFIKTMKYVLQNIRSQKHLLQKIIKQLWDFMINIKEPSLSLIHERIFAFAVSTYFKGQVSCLDDQKDRNRLRQILGLSDQKQGQILNRLVNYHLQNSINNMLQGERMIPQDYVRQYFNIHNNQMKIGFKLDCLYQKILVVMTQQFVIYPSAFICLLKKFEDNQSTNLLKQQLQNKGQTQKPNSGPIGPERDFQSQEQDNWKKIIVLISYLNSILAVDADQIQIQTQIELHNKDRLNNFFGKFINSYKTLKARKVKDKVSLVISDKNLFQSYMKECCIIEKEILKPKDRNESLQFLEYSFYLDNLMIDIEKQPGQQHIYHILPYLKNVVMWNDDAIKELINISRKVCQFHNEIVVAYNEHKYLPSLLGLELIKVYLITKSPILQAYLKELYEIVSKLGCQKLSGALKQFLNIPDLQNTEKDIPMLVEGKKNPKNKKEEMMSRIRANQSLIIKAQGGTEQKFDGPQCIYCKQKTQEPLMLIASVSIDNLFNKSFLKTNSFRLCFRTCKHTIHKSCFYKDENLGQKNCYLCRRPTNLLMPICDQKSTQIPANFLQDLIPILLQSQVSETNQEIIFEQLIQATSEQNLYRGLVNAIISQILLFDISQDQFAKFYIVPIIKNILNYLRLIPKAQLQRAFEIDKQKIPANSNKTHLYSLARQNVQECCLGKKPSNSIGMPQNDHSINLRKIINYFYTEKQVQICRQQLPLVRLDKELFDLPISLAQLQKEMGKCPSCESVTENICLCLVCGYKVCTKERPKLVEHFISHLGGAVMIKCDNGMPLYMTNEDYLFLRPSIYQNYLGQPFENKNLVITKKVSQYNLDKLSYSSIEQSLIRNQMKALILKQTA